jgi:MoxR-like ATPase
MQSIVDVHFPNIGAKLVEEAMRVFYSLRDVNNLKKKPSTSELIDWLRLLQVGGLDVTELKNLSIHKGNIPFEGALLKNEQDAQLLKMMSRSNFR